MSPFRPDLMRLTLAACAVGAGLAIQGFFAVGTARGDSPCPAWAGEFDPLPTIGDPDPLRARWARLRADQLVQLASRAEPRDRSEANRLWQRVRCLEPDSAAALEGIDRTRPENAARAPEPTPPARPTPIVRVRPPSREQRSPETPSVAAPLARTEELIRSARFDDALGEIERLRPEAVRPAERARLEVLAATAQVAFGDDTAARASIGRALRADPALAFDARSTSPKLLRVLDEARAVAGAPPYTPATADVTPLAEPASPP